MKKFLLMTMLGASVSLSVFASALDDPEKECHDLKIMNVLSLTDQDLSKLTEGESSKVAIEFSANTILPLHFFLKGDFMSLVENKEYDSAQLNVKQTFYVRCIKKELVFSSNLIEWKSFLEFVTGTASVVLGTQEDRVFITVGAETHLRS